MRDGRDLLGQYLDLLVDKKEDLRKENAKLIKQNEAFLAEKERSSEMVPMSNI